MGLEQTRLGSDVGCLSGPGSGPALPPWVRPEFEVVSTGMELSMYAGTAPTSPDL